MNTNPAHGEVWVADFGLVAKTRPVLVLSDGRNDDARALVIVAPLTSQIRNQRGEVPLGKIKWLPKPSAVNVQGLSSIGKHVLERRIGTLGDAQLESVKDAIRDLLGL
ncbi:MAG: type II toxin-antitoxin system PemK/MazF family toxin [Puniceicoccales bacterium]|nr:type II toxin-antitoxin system PemK/MazF family toxin [Puniceicoccales bacterium]